MLIPEPTCELIEVHDKAVAITALQEAVAAYHTLEGARALGASVKVPALVIVYFEHSPTTCVVTQVSRCDTTVLITVREQPHGVLLTNRWHLIRATLTSTGLSHPEVLPATFLDRPPVHELIDAQTFYARIMSAVGLAAAEAPELTGIETVPV